MRLSGKFNHEEAEIIKKFMEKLKPGRPKMLNTDKFILSCGLCQGKVYNPNSKRAYCEGRCKNRDIQDWYYLLDGAVYYNKYTREE